jgi:hypothetical protein
MRPYTRTGQSILFCMSQRLAPYQYHRASFIFRSSRIRAFNLKVLTDARLNYFACAKTQQIFFAHGKLFKQNSIQQNV